MSRLGWSAIKFQGSAACLRVTFRKGKRLRLGFRERDFRGLTSLFPVTIRLQNWSGRDLLFPSIFGSRPSDLDTRRGSLAWIFEPFSLQIFTLSGHSLGVVGHQISGIVGPPPGDFLEG